MDIEETAKNQRDGHIYRALMRQQEDFASRHWQIALFRIADTMNGRPLYLFCIDNAPAPLSAELVKNFARDLMQRGDFERLADGQLMEGSPATARAGGPSKGGILDKYNLINIARNAVQYEEFPEVPALFLVQTLARGLTVPATNLFSGTC